MNFNKSNFEKAIGDKDQFDVNYESKVVLAGRSNVGKSSLLNKLFNNRKLAHVSSDPGKTVTINYYRVDGRLLIDLPGYGYAKSSKEQIKHYSELTNYFFENTKNIRLVLLLIDMRREPTDDDWHMIEYMQSHNMKFSVILTKADKLNKSEFKNRFEKAQAELSGYNCEIIPFSANSGIGLKDVKMQIENAFKQN